MEAVYGKHLMYEASMRHDVRHPTTSPPPSTRRQPQRQRRRGPKGMTPDLSKAFEVLHRDRAAGEDGRRRHGPNPAAAPPVAQSTTFSSSSLSPIPPAHSFSSHPLPSAAQSLFGVPGASEGDGDGSGTGAGSSLMQAMTAAHTALKNDLAALERDNVLLEREAEDLRAKIASDQNHVDQYSSSFGELTNLLEEQAKEEEELQNGIDAIVDEIKARSSPAPTGGSPDVSSPVLRRSSEELTRLQDEVSELRESNAAIMELLETHATGKIKDLRLQNAACMDTMQHVDRQMDLVVGSQPLPAMAENAISEDDLEFWRLARDLNLVYATTKHLTTSAMAAAMLRWRYACRNVK